MPSAPAAHGIFSTLFCESFLRCLSPYPGGSTECTCLVLPQRHRPSPTEKWVGFPRLSREHDFSRTPISGLQLFLYVQASEFACLPGRSHRYRFPCRAAEAFTSEPNVHRCLCTHRICYPPDYRQLAERGLTPRKIHSIVDCSSQFWGALHEAVESHVCAKGAQTWGTRLVGKEEFQDLLKPPLRLPGASNSDRYLERRGRGQHGGHRH